MPEWFAQAFGAAMEDIRQKVVEEPTYGRTVTPPTLSQFYGKDHDPNAQPRRDAPEQDIGIDR
jgi:hypothetical protein